jgi:hypothetical protein
LFLRPVVPVASLSWDETFTWRVFFVGTLSLGSEHVIIERVVTGRVVMGRIFMGQVVMLRIFMKRIVTVRVTARRLVMGQALMWRVVTARVFVERAATGPATYNGKNCHGTSSHGASCQIGRWLSWRKMSGNFIPCSYSIFHIFKRTRMEEMCMQVCVHILTYTYFSLIIHTLHRSLARI